jgi:hypothetical protein
VIIWYCLGYPLATGSATTEPSLSRYALMLAAFSLLRCLSRSRLVDETACAAITALRWNPITDAVHP